MKKRALTSRGFSLLELLIYLAILSIMSVVLATAFITLTRGRSQNEARTEVQANARFAMDKISQDIANASSITSPTTTVSNTLQLVVNGATVQYAVSNGQLQRTVGGNPDAVTSTRVTVDAPVFTRADNYNAVLNATTTSVQTQLTVHYNTTSPDWTYAVTMRGTTSPR